MRDEVPSDCFGVRDSLPRYLPLLGFRVLGGHLHLLPPDLDIGTERCRLSCSVPRPLQSCSESGVVECDHCTTVQ